ncbi:MAG: OB-fold nucleic acid binding domain-containing protein [Candidatus Nanohaloarchaea archaeon]|nr:OB-fold nucleic acid binding domain-containing protein [Candidatus Nanohaloarchaea archaeon]
MVDELVSRISEESDASEEDVRQRISSKVEELSGLVSEEGAAHLVAREEGIELAEAGEKDLTVDNIVPGMNRVDLKCKVVDIGDVNTFDSDDGEGKVRNVVLGDPTGTVRMTLWNDQVEVADKMEEGESIEVQGAYSREDNRGNVELRVGDSTQIGRLEEDIGEVASAPSGGSGDYERVNTRNVMNENRNYEVQGTVVEVYADSPFYKACPECQKKVEEEESGWVCDEHGEVEPRDNLIVSAIIDDGYGNVRTVFFRDRARELLQADERFEGDEEKVQRKAQKVKGQEVEVRGSSRYNDFFNRIELIGDEVNPLDEEEILEQRLEGVM